MTASSIPARPARVAIVDKPGDAFGAACRACGCLTWPAAVDVDPAEATEVVCVTCALAEASAASSPAPPAARDRCGACGHDLGVHELRAGGRLGCTFVGCACQWGWVVSLFRRPGRDENGQTCPPHVGCALPDHGKRLHLCSCVRCGQRY